MAIIWLTDVELKPRGPLVIWFTADIQFHPLVGDNHPYLSGICLGFNAENTIPGQPLDPGKSGYLVTLPQVN